MDINFAKFRSIKEKCGVCGQHIKDIIRSTSLSLKEENAGVYKIKVCEKCVYRLPTSLVVDMLKPNWNTNHQFGNKIFSALKTTKRIDMNQGCVVLLSSLDNKNKYQFIKFDDFDLFLEHESEMDNQIDSIYIEGKRLSRENANE